MTAIVGLVSNDIVYIGGDSAGIDDYNLLLLNDPKVFVNGPFLIGFTSSYRMGQLLRYKLDVPTKKAGVSLLRFMATDFIDAVRVCLKDGGLMSVSNNTESGGCFLVGYRGHLFQVGDDFAVHYPAANYAAVGHGSAYALGCLYATRRWKDPEKRVNAALEAAEAGSIAVRKPFLIKRNNSEY